jgi:hypothetical protein
VDNEKADRTQAINCQRENSGKKKNICPNKPADGFWQY